MKFSDLPDKFGYIWAHTATATTIRTIPDTTVDPVAASLELGWPLATLTPTTAGGTPPNGKDSNGLQYRITAWLRWMAAGGKPPPYDSSFSGKVGGYPQGAVLADATTLGRYWISLVDDNTDDPAAGGANWIGYQTYPTVYAGDPNGSVAGFQGIAARVAPSRVWDIGNKTMWVCTTTGNAAAAIWEREFEPIAPVTYAQPSGPNWFRLKGALTNPGGAIGGFEPLVQWGGANMGSTPGNVTNVTFPIPMSTSSYFIMTGVGWTAPATPFIGASVTWANKSTTGFSMINNSSTTGAFTAHWMAMGG